MSYLETDDKILLVGFAGSVALICVLYVITWCVARPADGLRWAALAVVVPAIGLAAWCIPRLVRPAERAEQHGACTTP